MELGGGGDSNKYIHKKVKNCNIQKGGGESCPGFPMIRLPRRVLLIATHDCIDSRSPKELVVVFCVFFTFMPCRKIHMPMLL